MACRIEQLGLGFPCFQLLHSTAKERRISANFRFYRSRVFRLLNLSNHDHYPDRVINLYYGKCSNADRCRLYCFRLYLSRFFDF